MEEKFEMELTKAMEKYNKTWYEIYDSKLFKEVEKSISKKFFNNDIEKMLSNEEYKIWNNNMYWEL